MAAGSDIILSGAGKDRILHFRRKYFASGWVGSVNREAVRPPQFGRTDQTADVFSAEFDLLRSEAGDKMQIGGVPP